jgi:hypothetical protein
MPRSEAYNLYLSVGSGFHNAQKGQTTLPRVAGRGEAACLERKGYARRALSTRKTRYFSHNSFGTKRHTAKAWFLQALFPQPGSAPEGRGGEGGTAAVSSLGSIYHACAAGATPKKRNSVFFCMEKDGASMKKSRLHQKDTKGTRRIPAA